MMSFMGGITWLWMLAALLIVAGLVAAIASAFSGSSSDGDDALRILRARFARGEIDADAFDKAKATLGAEPTGRKAPRLLLIVAIGLLIAGALTASLASAVAWRPGGMSNGCGNDAITPFGNGELDLRRRQSQTPTAWALNAATTLIASGTVNGHVMRRSAPKKKACARTSANSA